MAVFAEDEKWNDLDHSFKPAEERGPSSGRRAGRPMSAAETDPHFRNSFGDGAQRAGVCAGDGDIVLVRTHGGDSDDDVVFQTAGLQIEEERRLAFSNGEQLFQLDDQRVGLTNLFEREAANLLPLAFDLYDLIVNQKELA